MVRDFDSSAPKGTHRVLVCITAQSNSERLIDAAALVADKNNAEFHILNVNKGTSIFNNSKTPLLLEELFEYGTERGGMVHMLCSDNVAKSIGDFIKEYGITTIVLGEPPKKINKKSDESEFESINYVLNNCGAEIIVIKREK
jgi:K+-sensing histidine kinase KdpD